ncbi:hypothetical protein ACP4OV_021116 [Aristida adscensionis]
MASTGAVKLAAVFLLALSIGQLMADASPSPVEVDGAGTELSLSQPPQLVQNGETRRVVAGRRLLQLPGDFPAWPCISVNVDYPEECVTGPATVSTSP